jgi:ABC-2 type transport system ATP-binding protein
VTVTETVTTTTPPPLRSLNSQALLRFEDVSKWYGPVLALNQVWFPLAAGITGLVGANGAGKSTLIKLATGMIRPTIGRVTVEGIDASSPEARRLIGYCPDHDAFYEDLTGREFVLTMARLCGFSRAEAHQRTEAVLVQVGMDDRADRKLRGYSKGMRQRVKLAQALLNDPKLLILDEPLSGVDPIGRQELLELFRSLAASGKALLISSHELEELEKLTDEVIIMARGRIADRGTVSAIRDRLENFPLTIRIETPAPRQLSRRLLADDLPEVLGCELDANDTTSLLVRVMRPRQFFAQFARLAVSEQLDIKRFEPLDDSAHAILGYLLGGSGKT